MSEYILQFEEEYEIHDAESDPITSALLNRLAWTSEQDSWVAMVIDSGAKEERSLSDVYIMKEVTT